MKVFNKDGEPLTKESFLEGIRKLHMGEWKRSYSPERFGHMVLDGTQWEIEIEYDNGHRKVRFDGIILIHTISSICRLCLVSRKIVRTSY